MPPPPKPNSRLPVLICTCGKPCPTSAHFCFTCMPPIAKPCLNCGTTFTNSIRGVCTACYEIQRLSLRAALILRPL